MRRAIIAVSLPLLGPAVVADVATLESSKDNTLYLTAAGQVSNGAGNGMYSGTTALHSPPQLPEVRRAVFMFDVAAAVPAGSTVTRVQVQLTCTQTRSGPSAVALHRLTAAWGEGTSLAGGGGGGGAPATPSDCTWTDRIFPGTLWATPGGDFDPSPSASQSVDVMGPYVWGPSAALVSDVQAWVDNPGSNFGWLARHEDEGPTFTAKRFDTHESPNLATRPQLVVEFTPPCYADCATNTGPGVLDIFDFLCFLNEYAAGTAYACDCNTQTGVGVCDIFDFLCFQNEFAAGCR